MVPERLWGLGLPIVSGLLTSQPDNSVVGPRLCPRWSNRQTLVEMVDVLLQTSARGLELVIHDQMACLGGSVAGSENA
jgi:hypothetical protein